MLIRLEVLGRSLSLVIIMTETIIEDKGLKTKKYSDFYTTTFGKTILEKELVILNRELSGCQRVLSIGCGPAIHELELTKLNSSLEVICVEPSDMMLKEAQQLLKDMKLIQGIAEQLPLKNEMFDCVYFLTSFEFIKDSMRTLKETSRVLKPGGALLLLISNFKSWYFQKEHAESNSYFESKIEHFDNTKLNEIISKQFKISSVTLELGIKGEEIFESSDPKWASLYVIFATKREVNN